MLLTQLITLSFFYKNILKIISKPMSLRHSLTFFFFFKYHIQSNVNAYVRVKEFPTSQAGKPINK